MVMESIFLPLLGRQNVWWDGRIEDDVHLSQWSGHEFKWVPFDLGKLSLEPFSLNTVVGPRQAGKTTLLKFAVKKLLDSGVRPKSIFYARCDEIIDARQLREVVETFFAFAGSRQAFIFLDEVTDVAGWEKVVKGFIDDEDFREAVVTVSGSNAFQLQKGAELFPGRRGKGKDVAVLPLSFRDYLSVVDEELASRVPKLGDLSRIRLDDVRKLLSLQARLQKHFYNYIQSGGFPLAVLSHLKDGKVCESAKEAYKSWVVGDILKNGKSDVVGREILKVILSKAPSPLSWEGIAQETSIKSPPTIASYVELFERLFVALPLYAVDPNNGAREFAKNKKIHLQDPFLWHLLEEWCMQPVERKSEVIVEACLACHVARFLSEKHGGKRLGDYVSYWKNGYEIDVVAHAQGGLSGFEIKWTDRQKAFALKVGPIKNLTYLSKNVFKEKPPTIPLALFLAML